MTAPAIRYMSPVPGGGGEFLIGQFLWVVSPVQNGGWGLWVASCIGRGRHVVADQYTPADSAELALFTNSDGLYDDTGAPVRYADGAAK